MVRSSSSVQLRRLHKLKGSLIMTNEEVYVQFLKKHRKFSAFKRQRFQGFKRVREITKVENAVGFSFLWSSTPEGHEYWEKLSREWKNLRMHFKLIGNIDLSKVN